MPWSPCRRVDTPLTPRSLARSLALRAPCHGLVAVLRDCTRLPRNGHSLQEARLGIQITHLAQRRCPARGSDIADRFVEGRGLC